MTPDLEALSREIAATSDAWMVPGVEAIAEGRLGRAIGLERDGFWLFFDGRVFAVKAHLCRPNLADPVTVNSLLGDGEVWEDGGGWLCDILDIHIIAPDRTTAICRAWIAANREKP